MTEQAQRIALITGGSRGLGHNMATSLIDRGVDVIVTYRERAESAQAVVAYARERGRGAAALQLDVGDVASFGAFADRLRGALLELGDGKLDFLVNNAGHGVHAPFVETTPEQLRGLVDVHFVGPFLLTQRVVGLMRDGGRILNISSGLARFTIPGYSAYAALKGAVEVLTRYQAKELGGRGITVNALAPGAIETDFGGGAVRDNPELNKFVASTTALGRVGVPDDIGPAVAMLLAPESRWITGQRIEASGGQML
ncbi:MAG: SDR family oxidoreductase [Myxococcales bacterium]|nr:SDR family oxidoreductase [Myxococcales bacterium]